MKIRYKYFILACCSILVSQVLKAQCDKCQPVKEFSPVYCFVDERFPDYCAQFDNRSAIFKMSIGKKTKDIPLINVASEDEVIKLALDKRLKISGSDILFIKLALEDWGVAERDLGMNFEESGLGIKILKEGEGPIPQKGQKVQVHYTGLLADGMKFDSSVDRGTPFSFTVGRGQVIKGWDEALMKIKQGTKALIKIPPELGYGKRGAGGVIPPDAILYFEIELLEIE
jgi:hypothetical protein